MSLSESAGKPRRSTPAGRRRSRSTHGQLQALGWRRITPSIVLPARSGSRMRFGRAWVEGVRLGPEGRLVVDSAAELPDVANLVTVRTASLDFDLLTAERVIRDPLPLALYSISDAIAGAEVLPEVLMGDCLCAAASTLPAAFKRTLSEHFARVEISEDNVDDHLLRIKAIAWHWISDTTS